MVATHNVNSDVNAHNCCVDIDNLCGSHLTLNNSLPIHLTPHAQQKISKLSDASQCADILSQCLTLRDKARWLSCSVPHSGDWLTCVPLKALGLSMSPDEFRVSLNYRLGVKISNTDQTCPKCPNVLDQFGDHAVGCSSEGGRIFRHDRIRDVIFNCARKAALSPVLEKPNISVSTRSRPADIFFYHHGLMVALQH